MHRWKGKVAVVTGASAGIGAGIAADLVKHGLQVVGLARRVERIHELSAKLSSTVHSVPGGKLHGLKCDLTEEKSIKEAFEWIEEKFNRVDILINNAGIYRYGNLLDEDNSQMLRTMMETNVMSYVYCTKEAFRLMRTEGNGHVVLINSTSGHNFPYLVGQTPSSNLYEPTKYAITAMTETLRQEFQRFKTKIKITSISPGNVLTEMFTTNLDDHISIPVLKVEDVCAAILYVLGTPPHVQVHELTIKPLGEEFL